MIIYWYKDQLMYR